MYLYISIMWRVWPRLNVHFVCRQRFHCFFLCYLHDIVSGLIPACVSANRCGRRKVLPVDRSHQVSLPAAVLLPLRRPRLATHESLSSGPTASVVAFACGLGHTSIIYSYRYCLDAADAVAQGIAVAVSVMKAINIRIIINVCIVAVVIVALANHSCMNGYEHSYSFNINYILSCS